MANKSLDRDRSARVRSRPPLFRALGRDDPAAQVEIAGVSFQRTDILKHDSWAATAIYESACGEKVVCKFNRQQSILRLPMRWLGRWLARRETAMLERLADSPLVPPATGPVCVAGRALPHVAAHAYVPGHPLGDREHVGDQFFAELRGLLDEMHRRGLAYVDLHKRENILVDEAGRPCLIDFQISLALPLWWPANSFLFRFALSFFQASDLYHLFKHRLRCRPDQLTDAERASAN